MPRDMIEEAMSWPRRLWRRVKATRRRVMTLPDKLGLSAKLLLLTLLFVMLAEVLIFVPSVANFRISWLSDRLTASRLAALAAQDRREGSIPQPLRSELLRTAQVRAVSWLRNSQHTLVLPPERPETISARYDLTATSRTGGFWGDVALRAHLIWDAMAVFFADDQRVVAVIGEPVPGDKIMIVLPESALKAAMIRYGLNILGLSIIISVITAALVYLALNSMFVQPMTRITRNILSFSQNPEDASRIIEPSQRNDEIGIAERGLAHMQGELAHTLQQKNRLAALGLAVSKISHDMRNMLASAQLISDRLGSLPDPTVQRFAPKLISSLDRAINLCESTLRFGRAEEAPPRREPIALRALVSDVGDGLGLPREDGIAWTIDVASDIYVDADRDQLYRVLSNLCRNALQALEQQEGDDQGHIRVSGTRNGDCVVIDVHDNGPGVPEKARAHLFQAFQGAARQGGTGLGLAVAHELVTAHGGSIRLVEVGAGTQFRIEIPDRRG
ncbi:MAG TPA: HAMP domain-containing sensor histidine kinase [Hyphomicrobiaceae bacterium]|nr:HAMP domain-containing sensor histidine kinase [Hyphomicrobiaceae bacterium]